MINKILFVLKSFDESKHKRHAKGDPEGKGGQFAKKTSVLSNYFWNLPEPASFENRMNAWRAAGYGIKPDGTRYDPLAEYERWYKEVNKRSEAVIQFNKDFQAYSNKVADQERKVEQLVKDEAPAEVVDAENRKFKEMFSKYDTEFSQEKLDALRLAADKARAKAGKSLWAIEDALADMSHVGATDRDTREKYQKFINLARKHDVRMMELGSQLMEARNTVDSKQKTINSMTAGVFMPRESDARALVEAQSRVVAISEEMQSIQKNIRNALLRTLGSKKPGGVEVENRDIFTSPIGDVVREGVRWFNELVGLQKNFKVKFAYKQIDRLDGESESNYTERLRAYYNPSDNTIHLNQTSSATVVVHELGHALDENTFVNPVHPHKAGDESGNYHWVRVQRYGGKPEKLVDIYPHGGYKPHEETIRDDYMHAYVGKLYPYYVLNEHAQATEITSMGLEFLQTKPFEFARRDPDHFMYIMQLLKRISHYYENT